MGKFDRQSLLHKAEEYGQSRELKPSEVGAFCLVSSVKALMAGVAAGVVVTGCRAAIGEDVTLASVVMTAGGVAAVSLAIHVWGDLDTLVEGLRSFRSAESYVPPQPEAPQQAWRPPVPVIRGGQPAGYVDLNERPALPAREEALQLTPPVVAEILRATWEQYGGEWSRRKLMALRVYGQKVSRGMYEELTGALHQCGFLQQTRQGGFAFPPDVSDFEDLRSFFPGLPGLGGLGREGREPGGMGTGGPQVAQAAGRGVRTLAERHRLERWEELDCGVREYLGREA